MKKFTIKSLLIAAALCLGTSAGAKETTTTYNFEDGKAVFRADSRITLSVENDAILNSNVVSFTCAHNAQNGYSFAHYDFTELIVDGTTQVTINFDYYNTDGGRAIVSIGDAATRGTTGGSSKTTYNGTGALFRLGSNKDYAILNGSDKLSKKDYCNIWMNVNVVVDLINKRISYVIKKKTDESVISEDTNVAYYNDAKNCTQIDLFGYINNSKCALIDNLSITSFVDENIQKKGYTINYKFGEKTIYTTSGELAVGGTVETKTVITVGEDKYLSVEDAKQLTITADGPNTWDIEVRKPFTATVSLVNTIAGEDSAPINKTFTETDDKVRTWTVGYPMYVLKGGVYYKLDGNIRGESGTFDENNQTIKKYASYSKEDNTVAYFTEVEDISTTNLTSFNANYSAGHCSAIASNGKTICTLETGAYKVETYIQANTNRGFYLRDGNNGDNNTNIMCSGSAIGTYTGSFVIGTSTPIIISGYTNAQAKLNQSSELDYILITKVPNPTVTITSAGYATFSSTYAVDFSESGLTAYTATVSDNKVVLTPIENRIVPANTGVILKGAEKNYTGVITTKEAVIEKNDLVAATEEIAELATTDGTYNNYILNVVEGKVGFYQANNKKVAAGKAYLQVPVTNGAKALTIVWNDGETTGIEENYELGTMNSDAATFDLSGRKVANPAKGLYIKNGKKFIVK